MKKYGSKGNDKTICKKRLYWADQMVLPWSDTTKLPIGVAMVQVSQVPNWNRGIMPIKWRGNGSGSTKPPSDSMAFGRSRGVTGSDLTMSPSDLVAVAYQKVSRWFGHDQGPQWCYGTRPIKRRGYGSDTTKPPSDQ